MRLKSIKLAGFKSFVDPTTAKFPSNLSAVVGPNGCGKSNIIDAVRWVMGESSAKHLRGESMTDVIFNGSGSRKPVGQASIELVFDNSDGSLGGEYATWSEIAIRRKVTRDGKNDYYLNGNKCRRRDITDIFLGTGLGPRSYAIIEQGMISRLIEAKPEELRVFIEEAAGISKYKERRRDTENRMRRTHENLERLTDIRDELERQLQHLKRQSAAAERYKELRANERLLKAQLQGLQWQRIDTDIQQRQEVIREFELEVEAAVTQQTSLDTELERHRLKQTELNDAFNKVQGRFYSIGADIARVEQSIQHQTERNQQLTQDFEQNSEALRQAKELLENDAVQYETWQEELLELEPEIDILKEAEENSAEALVEAEEAMQSWQQRWDEFNSTAADARQKAEVQQSRIQHMETACRRLQERITRLTEERDSLTADPIEEEIEMLSEQVAELDMALEDQQQSTEDSAQAIQTLRDNSRELSSELDSQRSDLRKQQGRYASLEALQQAALGDKGSAGQRWLESEGFAESARVAELIKVDEKWQLAAETVLGPYLQAVQVDDLAAISQSLGDLQAGSLSLIDGSAAAVQSGKSLSLSLLDVIDAPPAIKALAEGVYLLDDLAEAIGARDKLGAAESIITADGIWIGRTWLRVAREEDAQAGVLARQQEIETLAQSIADAEAQIETNNDSLSELRDGLKSQEQGRENQQQQLRDLTRQQGEARSQLNAKQLRIEQISARRGLAESELAELQDQIALEQENIAEARLILQDAIDSMEQDSNQREQLLAQRDGNRNSLDDARQQARQDRDRSHQLAMRVQSLKTQAESVQASMARTKSQVEQLEARREQLNAMSSETGTPVDDLKIELEAHLERRLNSETELTEARQALSHVEDAMRQAEKQRSVQQQQAQASREKLESARLELQSQSVRRNTLKEQLEEADNVLEDVLEALPEGANEAEWAQDIEQLANKISRLGAINLAAIEEYKQQSERKDYLDSQHDDLMRALEMLENAIRKIDKETRARFKETFDKVNSDLQELFPRVFGGGRAYLEMTGEDLLDTGIAIMAQPPGKRNSTIHLLSGGEKALTAIALVFSIFKLNPAPFCMLDEVDAPLDDANVGRYARMVKEMSSQVQFIYITHNKIAMEMAEHLLGVTMHEAGVSRLVTVDVAEAAELAEIA